MSNDQPSSAASLFLAQAHPGVPDPIKDLAVCMDAYMAVEDDMNEKLFAYLIRNRIAGDEGLEAVPMPQDVQAFVSLRQYINRLIREIQDVLNATKTELDNLDAKLN